VPAALNIIHRGAPPRYELHNDRSMPTRDLQRPVHLDTRFKTTCPCLHEIQDDRPTPTLDLQRPVQAHTKFTTNASHPTRTGRLGEPAYLCKPGLRQNNRALSAIGTLPSLSPML